MGLNVGDLDPVELGVLLSQQSNRSELIAAARAAVDVADARALEAAEHVEVLNDVGGAAVAGDALVPAQRTWAGRAEVDGSQSRAAEKAEELAAWPAPEKEEATVYDETLQSTVEEARHWAADREWDETARSRYADSDSDADVDVMR